MLKPDNHDSRIRYIDLLLERVNLENIPEYELPEGYRFVFYQPGDRDAWIAIEQSAKELADDEHGVRTRQRRMRFFQRNRKSRQIFLPGFLLIL